MRRCAARLPKLAQQNKAAFTTRHSANRPVVVFHVKVYIPLKPPNRLSFSLLSDTVVPLEFYGRDVIVQRVRDLTEALIAHPLDSNGYRLVADAAKFRHHMGNCGQRFVNCVPPAGFRCAVQIQIAFESVY